MIYHIGNLLDIRLDNDRMTRSRQQLIKNACISISTIIKDPKHSMSEPHYSLINQLDAEFRSLKEHPCTEEGKFQHHFTAELTIIYELLSLYDVLEELNLLLKNETKTRSVVIEDHSPKSR
jgi:hypothetical protein